MGYMPTWLQDQGYYTSYIGKLFMEYGIYNYNLKPRGFNHTDLLAYPWVFDYNHPVFSTNCNPPRHYPGNYSTDVIAEKAVFEIKNAAKLARAGIPFNLNIAPVACHDWMNWKDADLAATGKLLGPPLAPERYKNSFRGVRLPKKANFMEPEATFKYKAKWLRDLHPTTLKNTNFLNEYYRLRLRALAAADDMIERIMTTLEEEGILDDTYVFYTSDNGYHIGAHRMHGGKESPFEEDTRVPFFVRGPGIKKGITDNLTVSSHVDLPATFVTLAGGDFSTLLTDGQPMPMQRWAEDRVEPYFDAFRVYQQYEATPVEYWGGLTDQVTDVLKLPMHIQEQPSSYLLYPSVIDLLYKAYRADFSNGKQELVFKYIVSCGEDDGRELYDLTHDPFELYNLFHFSSTHHSDTFLKKIKNRMDALVSAGYACINYTNCIAPFANLNSSMEGWPTTAGTPALPIKSLAQSLNDVYDNFFKRYGEDNRFQWVSKGVPSTSGRTVRTGCLDYWDWDNEKGAFDKYAWIKPATNPHYVVDWGTFIDTAAVASTTPDAIAIAKSVVQALKETEPEPDVNVEVAIAAAQTTADEYAETTTLPWTNEWPGRPGMACSVEPDKHGGRKMFGTTQQLVAEEAPVEQFGREMSQQEIDANVAWMQRRIKTHPYELKYFR